MNAIDNSTPQHVIDWANEPIKCDIDFPQRPYGWAVAPNRRYIVVNEEVMGWIVRGDNGKHYVTIECGHDINRKQFDSSLQARNFVRKHFATA